VRRWRLQKVGTANANTVPAGSHIDQMLTGIARTGDERPATEGPSTGDKLDDPAALNARPAAPRDVMRGRPLGDRPSQPE
jgi:hypothetical protein